MNPYLIIGISTFVYGLLTKIEKNYETLTEQEPVKKKEKKKVYKAVKNGKTLAQDKKKAPVVKAAKKHIEKVGVPANVEIVNVDDKTGKEKIVDVLAPTPEIEPLEKSTNELNSDKAETDNETKEDEKEVDSKDE